MGLLDNFEKGLERAVNGAFAKTFRSGLAPVEITSALRRELDTKAAVISRDRILVPNSFRVILAPGDYQRMQAIGPTLTDDLIQFIQTHAKQQGYQFAGGISLELVQNARLTDGLVQIKSSNAAGAVTWTPVLDVAGKRYPITSSRTVIGRGSDADITIDDPGTSRKHVEILWDGQHAQVKDLGSTNGSQLNGASVKKATLEPESVIQIGRTRIVFRVLAQSASVDQYSDLRTQRQARSAEAPREQRPLPPRPDRPRHDPGGFWRDQS